MSAELTTATVQDARRHEKAPSGGWRTIGAKEFADHLGSVRFYVLLLIIASRPRCRCTSPRRPSRTPRRRRRGHPPSSCCCSRPARRRPAASRPSRSWRCSCPSSASFGLDAVNSERAQGTLSRLLAQPIHRDDVINGKFAAGIAIDRADAGRWSRSSRPSASCGWDDPDAQRGPAGHRLAARDDLYAGFWLAFGLLLSVVMRRADRRRWWASGRGSA